MKKLINKYQAGDKLVEKYKYGIPTAEETDNRLYQSSFGTMLPEVTVTAKGDPRKVNNDYYKAHSKARSDLQSRIADRTDYKSLNPINILEYTPVIGDALDVAHITNDVTNKNYLAAGIGAGMFLLPNIIEKPLKRFIPKALQFAEKHPKTSVSLVRKFARTPIGKRTAETILRSNSSSGSNSLEYIIDYLKNNDKYIITGKGSVKPTSIENNRTIYGRRNIGYYDGKSFFPEVDILPSEDIDATYLFGNKLNSKLGIYKPELGLGVHEDYINNKYPKLKNKIPIYETGKANIKQLYDKNLIDALKQGKVVSASGAMLGKDPNWVINTAGHRLVPTTIDGKPAFYEQDIYKYNPEDYIKKWLKGESTFIEKLGINLLDAAGTPVILRSIPTLLRCGGQIRKFKYEKIN